MLKHFSATCYVVRVIDGEPKVLLHLHKKHNNWYGLGGHVEGDEDPVAAAIREAKEEAGINVTILSPKKFHHFKNANELIPPFMLFDQEIDGDHRHIDCIYVGTTNDEVKMAEQYKWFSIRDLDSMDLQEDTRHIAKEVIEFYKTFKKNYFLG